MRLVEALDGMEDVTLANIPVRSLRASHKVALDAERRRASILLLLYGCSG